MKEELEQWLESQDYAQGVNLYQKYGSDQVLLTLFSLPETSFTRSKLEAGIRSLLPKKKRHCEGGTTDAISTNTQTRPRSDPQAEPAA